MAIRLIFGLVAVAALTVGPALLAGKYLNRWGAPPDMEAAAKEVQSFPREFGAWKFDADGEPLSPVTCDELGLAGYISRTYIHRDTHKIVSLLLMVGQPGPLLRHPPNICYANRANEQVGAMTTFEAPDSSPVSKFSLLEYKPPQSLPADRFLVAYGMTTENAWSVPAMPRVEFGAAPKLYKVQMLLILDSTQDRAKGMAILQDFARDFCSAFGKLEQQASKESPGNG